jgi:tRNA G26 N,N-dimethylase Trm1
MEDIAWKKDETSYVLFVCSKCHQYIYSKATQKFKKCPRCGYVHKVTNVINNAEIVDGISNAVELLKKRQNDLAIKELGSIPDFRTSEDFKITGKVKAHKNVFDSNNDDDNLYDRFKQMLYKLSETHNSFPYYVIEIMAENSGIPQSEVKLLIRRLQRQGFLLRLNDDYSYTIRG